MAEFIVTIKVKLENLGLSQGSGTSSGANTGSNTGASKPQGGQNLESLSDLRREFSELASAVRTVKDSLQGIRQAAGQTIRTGPIAAGATPPSGGGGTGASGGGEGGGGGRRRDTGEDEVRSANESFADKTRKQAEEFESAAEETRKKIDEIGSNADKLVGSIKEQAASAESAVKSNEKIVQLSKVLSGGAANTEAAFNQLRAVSFDRRFRGQAAKADQSTSDLLRFDKNLGQKAQTEARGLTKQIDNLIAEAVQKADLGEATTQARKKFRDEARKLIEDFQTQFGKNAAKFDISSADQRIRSRELLNTVETANGALLKLGKELANNADEKALAPMRRQFEGFFEKLKNLTGRELSRAGKSVFQVETGRSDLKGNIQREDLSDRVEPFFEKRGIGGIDLNQRERRAVEQIQNQDFDVATRASRALDILGENLDEFEDSLRKVNIAVQDAGAAAGTPREEFEKLNEVLKLTRVKRSPGGEFQAPTAGSRDLQLNLARREIEQARANIGARSRGAETNLKIPVKDSLGNVRKLNVTLKQLGDTLDSVKVKARETSDNLFDRTSVQAALSRVATWGAAAGVVFGTVQLFQDAVDTVISTESAVVSLGKVMAESEKDFESFAAQARDTAIAIAQDFGQPLEDVLDTMVTFGQQGLNLDQVTEASKAAALASQVTVLDQPTAASALTAAIEQFGLEARQATTIVDKFNEVSNNAAVTEDVLAEALKKAGLAARNAGANLDEFNGVVAAISEQTRQSGQEIGTALRFIFSRLTTEEAEQGLSDIGVSIRDTEGQLRGFVPIVQDVADKFDTLTEAQKTSAAIAISGTRRFNTFLALIDNFSEFQESAANSANSLGSAIKEQEKITETAEFRLQRLKNAAAETALEFGDVFVGALKATADGLTSFLGVINQVPDSIKGIGIGLSLGTAAFVKFSDQITNFIDLTAGGGVFRGLFGGIKGRLTQGVSEQSQELKNLSKFVTDPTGIVAAKSVGDFFAKGTGGATAFSSAIEDTNRVLARSNGQIVKNASSFSKFSAVLRGFKVGKVDEFGNAVQATTLGIASMNTGFSKLLTTIGRFATRITGMNALFNALERNTQLASTATGALISNILRFAGAGAVIFGVVKAYSALKEEITTTGFDAADALDSEIAKRQETINEINKQKNAVQSLQRQREEVATQVPIGDQDLRRQRIAGGGFRSPELNRIRLRESQQDAAQGIATLSPQLVQSVDELGNVTLKGADAFDTLAEGAASAEKALLSLAEVKAIEALTTELQPAGGLKKFGGDFVRFFTNPFTDAFDDLGLTLADQFDRELKNFRSGIDSQATEIAGNLGVDLRLIDPQEAERIQGLSQSLFAASAEVRGVLRDIENRIQNLPQNAPEETFRDLALSAGPAIDRFAELQTVRQGRQVRSQDILNRFFLQNQGDIQDSNAQQLIGTTAEETLGKFNENKVVAELVQGRENIVNRLQQATAGELVLFENVKGFTQQAIVDVQEDGTRTVKFIADELGREAERTARQVAQNVEQVRLIDPKKFAQQITVALAEASKVAVGAGREAIISDDIDLGADFRFQLGGQQRASIADPRAAFNLLSAQRERDQFIEGLSSGPSQLAERATSGELSLEFSNQIRELNESLDEAAIVFKYRSSIEELNSSFEESIEEIEANIEKQDIAAKFSEKLGALAGVIEREFDDINTIDDLSGQQLFDRRNPELVKVTNAVVASRKATQEQLKEQVDTRRALENSVKDFIEAGSAGGIRDPRRTGALLRDVSKLTEDGISRANATQAALLKESNSIEQQQLETLNKLLDASTDEVTGERLAEVADQIKGIRNEGSREALTDRLVDRINNLGQGALESFSSNTISEILSVVSREDLNQRARGSFNATLSQSVASTFLSDALSRVNLRRKREEEDTPDPQSAAIQRAEVERNKALQTALGRVLQESGLGTDFEITDQSVRKIGLAFAEELIGLPNRFDSDRQIESFRGSGLSRDEIAESVDRIEEQFKRIAEEGGRIARDIGAGDEETLSSLRQALSAIVPQQDRSPAAATEDRDVVGEAARQGGRELELRRQITTALERHARANESIIVSLNQFGQSLTEAEQTLRVGLTEAIQQIEVDRQLAPFTTDATGALQGVQRVTGNLGETSPGATGITERENQNLVSNINAADAVVNTLVERLTELRGAEAQVRRQRQLAFDRGDTEAIRIADRALEGFGNTATAIEQQINQSRETLDRFGDAFRNLEAINQLRVDIDGLLQDFRNQQELRFDRTSIQSALGNGPFSLTRPSFEQFQQGQSGFATKFERAIDDLTSQLRSGNIGFEEFRTGRRRAEFERDEGIIQFAQSRENESLQAEVQAAEQVRERLLEFASQGGPQANQARALVDSLTSQLERAGDIRQTNIGSRRIRNPLTGRDERIPASEILEFRGIPGLDQFQREVSRLAEQAKAQDIQEQADAITQPLLDLGKEELAELKRIGDSLDEGIDTESVQEDRLATSKFAQELRKVLPAALTLQRGERLNEGQSAGLVAFARSLQGFDPAQLQELFAVQTEGGKTLASIFEGVAAKGADAQKALGVIQKSIEGIKAPAEDLEKLGTSSSTLNDAFVTLSETVDTLSQKIDSLPFVGGDSAQKKATGGLITGPGGPREDKVPVMASPGEFVINAASANKLGLDTLNKLNSVGGSGPIKRSGSQRAFQDGGLVPVPDNFNFGFELTDEDKRRRKKLRQEEADRIREQKRLPGRRVTDGFEKGEVFVRFEDGRPLFTNIGDRGAVDVTDAAGASLSSEGAFKAEIQKRRKNQKRIDEFREKKRREAFNELLKETEAKESKNHQIRIDFTREALQEKNQRFISEYQNAISQFNTARDLLGGESLTTEEAFEAQKLLTRSSASLESLRGSLIDKKQVDSLKIAVPPATLLDSGIPAYKGSLALDSFLATDRFRPVYSRLTSDQLFEEIENLRNRVRGQIKDNPFGLAANTAQRGIENFAVENLDHRFDITGASLAGKLLTSPLEGTQGLVSLTGGEAGAGDILEGLVAAPGQAREGLTRRFLAADKLAAAKRSGDSVAVEAAKREVFRSTSATADPVLDTVGIAAGGVGAVRSVSGLARAGTRLVKDQGIRGALSTVGSSVKSNVRNRAGSALGRIKDAKAAVKGAFGNRATRAATSTADESARRSRIAKIEAERQADAVGQADAVRKFGTRDVKEVLDETNDQLKIKSVEDLLGSESGEDALRRLGEDANVSGRTPQEVLGSLGREGSASPKSSFLDNLGKDTSRSGRILGGVLGATSAAGLTYLLAGEDSGGLGALLALVGGAAGAFPGRSVRGLAGAAGGVGQAAGSLRGVPGNLRGGIGNLVRSRALSRALNDAVDTGRPIRQPFPAGGRGGGTFLTRRDRLGSGLRRLGDNLTPDSIRNLLAAGALRGQLSGSPRFGRGTGTQPLGSSRRRGNLGDSPGPDDGVEGFFSIVDSDTSDLSRLGDNFDSEGFRNINADFSKPGPRDLTGPLSDVPGSEIAKSLNLGRFVPQGVKNLIASFALRRSLRGSIGSRTPVAGGSRSGLFGPSLEAPQATTRDLARALGEDPDIFDPNELGPLLPGSTRTRAGERTIDDVIRSEELTRELKTALERRRRLASGPDRGGLKDSSSNAQITDADTLALLDDAGLLNKDFDTLRRVVKNVNREGEARQALIRQLLEEGRQIPEELIPNEDSALPGINTIQRLEKELFSDVSDEQALAAVAARSNVPARRTGTADPVPSGGTADSSPAVIRAKKQALAEVAAKASEEGPPPSSPIRSDSFDPFDNERIKLAIEEVEERGLSKIPKDLKEVLGDRLFEEAQRRLADIERASSPAVESVGQVESAAPKFSPVELDTSLDKRIASLIGEDEGIFNEPRFSPFRPSAEVARNLVNDPIANNAVIGEIREGIRRRRALEEIAVSGEDVNLSDALGDLSRGQLSPSVRSGEGFLFSESESLGILERKLQAERSAKGGVENVRKQRIQERIKGLEQEALRESVGQEAIDKLKEGVSSQGGVRRPKGIPGRAGQFMSKEAARRALRFFGIKGFQFGGEVSGPGGPKEDRVPILASNGEFVLNSESVKKLGLSAVEFMNKTGKLPSNVQKFQDGGLVGSSQSSGPGSVDINFDVEEISSAVQKGIATGLREATAESPLQVDAEQAASAITSALQDALSEPIELTVDAPTSIPLDAPESIPLDTSGLDSLGGNALGADVRNRLESVEGSVFSLREDTNQVLDQVEGLEDLNVAVIREDINDVRNTVEPLVQRVGKLETTVSTQKQEILDEAFFLINEQLNNLDVGSALEGKVERKVAEINTELERIDNDVSSAIRVADQALSKALAR